LTESRHEESFGDAELAKEINLRAATPQTIGRTRCQAGPLAGAASGC
jgi:hypothetical protein